MPIYEYICQDCGEKYEKFVRSSTAKIELVCPACGSQRGEKKISMFGAIGSTGSSSAGSSFTTPAPACGPIG